MTNYINYNHNNQFAAQYTTGMPHIPDYQANIENTYYYQSDTQQPPLPLPPATRSNEELNISVLRRHNPAITSILSLAPYVVVYIFSPVTQQWEKNGIEGTMFICQLAQGSVYGEERYSVFVLNRRGLNNFDILLTDGENVEITDEFVILKADGDDDLTRQHDDEAGEEASSSQIIGLWIFSEPPPNSTAETRKINAEVIKECATHAGRSLALAKESMAASQQQQPQQQAYASVPMGRQISLKELFGQQRAQDDGFQQTPSGVGESNYPMSAVLPNGGGQGAGMAWGHGQPLAPNAGQATNQPGGNVLTDLFLRAGLVNQG